MRLSEFSRAVEVEFGAQGDSLVADLVLGALAYRTAAQAIADGVDVRQVWLALCAETDVPVSRRHGVGHLQPRG